MKNKWLGWVLGVSVILVAYQAWAEQIAISTYYPSPYGSYTSLDATTLNSTTINTTTVTASGAVTALNLTATNAVNGATLTATGAVNGASVTASGAVSGATVTATGAVTGASVVANGMTIKGDSTDSGALQVASNGGKYYCYAVYAP